MGAPLRKHGVQSWILENFGAGLDLREGVFSLDQNRFADLQNVMVTKGRKIKRRPPCLLAAGSFGVNTLGLFVLNGKLACLYPKGQANIGTPTGVVGVGFDVPPGATTWAMVDVVTLNNTVCALIQHTVGAIQQLILHVMDSAPDLPTYVQDPAFPWTHVTSGIGRAVLAVAAEKLWCSGPDGNVYHSATANPRLWSTLDTTEIFDHGYEFHVYLPTTGNQTFSIPLNWDRFDTVTKSFRKCFCSWLVQGYTGTATGVSDYQVDANWGTALDEVQSSPSSGQCTRASTPNLGSAPTFTNWTAFTINAASAGWYRIRVFPPRSSINGQINNYVVSGMISPAQQTGVVAQARGDGVSKRFIMPTSMWYYDPSVTNSYTVTVDGVAKTWNVDFTVSTADNQVVIIMAAAPANGALLLVTQRVGGYASFFVGPGTFNTLSGLKAFSGGVAAVSNATGYHYMILTLDTNFNAVSISDLPNNTGFLSGKQLHYGVILAQLQLPLVGDDVTFYPVYNGVIYPVPGFYDPTGYLYRDATIDEAERLKALLSSGVDDAGFIATSNFDSGGGLITLLTSVKNRLLVGYQRASQLWAVFGDATLDNLVEQSAVGTGSQPSPYGVQFFGTVVLPSTNGIRSVDLAMSSFNAQGSDDLVDRFIGDPISPLGAVPVVAAAYWPLQGEYLAACTIDGAFGFLVYDYSKESKIASWNKWFSAGISGVDYRAMGAIDDRLYFRSGSALYYFDASATVFKDTNDGSGDAYTSLLMWHFNNMKRPESVKRYCGLELVMDGTATATFRTQPHTPLFEEVGPTVTGCTIGKPSIPLVMSSRSIAPVLRSTDPTGFNLEAIVLNFVFGGQGVL